MRHLIALTVLFASTVAGGPALAHSSGCDVDIESDYNLALNERSVILTRNSGAPKAIVMRQGRLFVDDAWVELSAADSQRVVAFEQSARAAMPEAQAISRAAADIAFSALGEVAAGFSSDPVDSRAKLAKARVQLDASLARSITATRFDGDDLGEGISEAIGEVLPGMIGDIVGGAISATFSGDPRRLQRMQGLDAQIEARVKPHAIALEQRAEGLCRRMVEIDRIDNALEYRYRGEPLDMLQVRPQRDAASRGPGRAGKSPDGV